MLRNNYLIFLFLFLFLPFASANGLAVVGETSFVVNKTVGDIEEVIFKIENQDSFTFHNISFEENDIISIDEIGSLASGENISVVGRINTNIDFSGDLRLVGLYEAFLGSSDETYTLDVDYIGGINDCSMSIIKGDTIVWSNLVLDTITMVNSETGQVIVDILQGENYSSTFETPETLNYHFLRRGFKFTNDCVINALDDQGYINNPDYDAFINLNVNVNYPPTTISSNFLETNYSINPYTEDEGFFSIKNEGSEIAKNVHLSGEWFSFLQNDFDISPGYSKTITYKIRPIVSETNDTGKDYIKNITIEGNFEKSVKQFNIFVRYLDIDNNEYGNSTDFFTIFRQQLNDYCEQFPNDDLCNNNPNIIYVDRNDSGNFNVSYNQEQVKQIYDFFFTYADSMGIKVGNIVEMISVMNSTMYSINSSQNFTQSKVKEFEEEKDKENSRFLFITFLLLTLILGGAFCWFAWNAWSNKKALGIMRWGKDRKKIWGDLVP